MARHTNNNSFNIQLRELEEEDELQGYDVKNLRTTFGIIGENGNDREFGKERTLQ